MSVFGLSLRQHFGLVLSQNLFHLAGVYGKLTNFFRILGDIVHENTSGKRATCIRIVHAKCESFSIHSPHDIQSRSVIPQNCRGITFWSYAVQITRQICLRTVRVLEFAYKMNVQLRQGLALEEFLSWHFFRCHGFFHVRTCSIRGLGFHTHTNTHTLIGTHISTRTHWHTHEHTHTLASTYTYMGTRTRTHTHTHTHTNTSTSARVNAPHDACTKVSGSIITSV